ncbi:hypothetical protein AVEN_139091-1 [Araneus ventricosus]|uniref:Uncharacterized protein n=1 Tax=Araneus ventricosus TaxID=182803 RepID=A0A4Y2KTN3_ARAVE|nr:hypothetical protein AVEN_139091-1 [Araneus ventricosus]
MDVSSRKYTTAWVNESRKSQPTNAQICGEISRREIAIDVNQGFAQKCRKVISDLQINGGNQALIESRNNELKTYESRVTENEEALITIGPCPIPTCTKHHEVTKDVEMAELGQYNIQTTTTFNQNYLKPLKTDSKPTENPFKVVTRKNAAKPRPTENTPEITTSNKFQHLIETEEQENPTEPPISLFLQLILSSQVIIISHYRKFPEITRKPQINMTVAT